MIRCQVEVIERAEEKKEVESRETYGIATRRLAFETLLRRDGDRWMNVETAHELGCVAQRAQRELIAGDFDRFVSWMAATHGHAFVRSAGLRVTRPHLSVASA